VLHARLRQGSSPRGHRRFVEELIARVRRAGATGALTVRGDSGFWSYALVDTLHRLGVHWSITVSISKEIGARIDAIDETASIPISYSDGGEAHGADTTITAAKSKRLQTVRLVVRRTRLADPAQAALWPHWRHHALITDVDFDVVEMDQFHRDHATVELAIRDLKDGAGLEHCPSAKSFANAAWLGCAVLAHNVTRWNRPPRQCPPRRPPQGGPHGAHPRARVARQAREPQRATRAPTSSAMALANNVHHRARPAPRSPHAELNDRPRTGAAQITTTTR
jgi:hypothetical protein